MYFPMEYKKLIGNNYAKDFWSLEYANSAQNNLEKFHITYTVQNEMPLTRSLVCSTLNSYADKHIFKLRRFATLETYIVSPHALFPVALYPKSCWPVLTRELCSV